MKLIKTEDAVGHVLCHDMTQIIKGQTKDALFRKGHIVTEEDIPLFEQLPEELPARERGRILKAYYGELLAGARQLKNNR